MAPSVIAAAGSIRQYFLEAVSAALEYLRFEPNEETRTYLVELLCECSRAAASFEQPLAVVLAEASRADPQTSIRALKRVGDHSLVLAGYFNASLRGKKLDPSYYLVLGSGAYLQLSRVLRHRRASAQGRLVVVYRELGDDFARFAEVLSEVRGRSEHGGFEGELGELYAEWLRTGSAGARQRLQAAGVLLVRRPGQRS